ncbi:MAG TPA: DNA polymerase III subunit gamma/tau [Ktedonobacteraceae bacterium]
MASQSLYRKWRSQTFSEFVGQEQIIHTLKNALSDGKLAHAYLFTGPRGTGKTTTARLLAKTINCSNPQNGEPCNTCDQCREITAGNSFNVMEIDAASNRGIDSIRELREKVMIPPSIGKYKVYILDEAHMLTAEAFNALLKTLEEPPPHAVFVLATTEVHKMLPTVLSRCQRFDFKRFTVHQIVDHLKHIAREEHVTLEQGAAELIARAAAGGMRDALSLLDQAIAYAGNEISLASVQAMLGVADPRAIQRFITCIAQLDSAAGLHLVHELSEAGADLRQINSQVAEYWRAMMLAKAGADIATILDSSEDERREITETARLFDLVELTECARVFAQNELVQKNQVTPQLGLELALLTCIELHRRAQAGEAVSLSSASVLRSTPPSELPRSGPQVDRLHKPDMPASGKAAPQPEMQREEGVQQAEKKAGESLQNITTFKRKEEITPSLNASPPSASRQEDMTAAVDVPVEGVQENDSSPTLTLHDVKEKWEYIKRRIRTKRDGAKIAAVLNGYTIVGVVGSAEQPVVMIKASHKFHYASLQNKKEYLEIIEWGLKVELSQECRVHLLAPHADERALHISSLSDPSEDGSGQTPTGSAHSTATQSPAQRSDMPPSQPVEEVPSPVSQIEWPAASSGEKLSPPLARKGTVRENTNKVTPYTSQEDTGMTHLERTKKKATSDPVVQKVVEMFKAEIKDINLK